MFPVGIVGILRFFFGVQRRCGIDVSTMDTSDLPDLFPPRIAASRTTSLPRLPARASASEVMTLTCPRSEETTHIPTTTNMTSAPSWARSTAEETVRTRAEGSTCAAAEEVSTNSPYPPVE